MSGGLNGWIDEHEVLDAVRLDADGREATGWWRLRPDLRRSAPALPSEAARWSVRDGAAVEDAAVRVVARLAASPRRRGRRRRRGRPAGRPQPRPSTIRSSPLPPRARSLPVGPCHHIVAPAAVEPSRPAPRNDVVAGPLPPGPSRGPQAPRIAASAVNLVGSAAGQHRSLALAVRTASSPSPSRCVSLVRLSAAKTPNTPWVAAVGRTKTKKITGRDRPPRPPGLRDDRRRLAVGVEDEGRIRAEPRSFGAGSGRAAGRKPRDPRPVSSATRCMSTTSTVSPPGAAAPALLGPASLAPITASVSASCSGVRTEADGKNDSPGRLKDNGAS